MQYDVIVMLSGGLDSLLCAKILERQGLRVQCLHCISPFFGSRDTAHTFASNYGLDVHVVDISEEYIAMLRNPKHGYGKHLNPCIDCKILMLRIARTYMEEYGAVCVATGEVLGQRPMSQHREAMKSIQQCANLAGYLLRPLTAKNLPPTIAEEQGIVQRDKLYGLTGRGRQGQFAIAKELGIKEIPSPAGGCALTIDGTARTYYTIMERRPNAVSEDFWLVRYGRQLWKGDHWLIVARNALEGQHLTALGRTEDYLIRFPCDPGPIALGRVAKDVIWHEDVRMSAIGCTIAYAPKIRTSSGKVLVEVIHNNVVEQYTIHVPTICCFEKQQEWQYPAWEDIRLLLREQKRCVTD